MHQLLYGLQLVGLDCLDELHSVLRRRNNEQATWQNLLLKLLDEVALNRSRDQTYVASTGGGRRAGGTEGPGSAVASLGGQVQQHFFSSPGAPRFSALR